MDRRKRDRIRKAAAAFLSRAFPEARTPPVRFDVAVVTPGDGGRLSVEILRDAFE